LAKPLSYLVANSMTAGLAQLAESYWCILLGKGAGTGWDLNAEIKAAKSTIRGSSPVIFDVGANMGEWSVLFNQLFPQAQIFLFEPQPVCQKIITERNIPGSILVPNAVSSTAGQTIKLFSSGDTAGIASLHQRRDSYFNDMSFTSINVNTVTIDDVIREHKIVGVDFMKMDVEGHELDVLKGAMKSLEARLIKAFSFEFGSGNINSRTFFHDFWDLLKPLGYDIYRILPSSRLMPIKEYYEDCEYFRGVTNYIAILS
jgi:FkbM family methyltransferase